MKDDDSLQAALSAQARKTNFQHWGAAEYNRTGPKNSQESKFPRSDSLEMSKLKQRFSI
jgi:hypothetical protein